MPILHHVGLLQKQHEIYVTPHPIEIPYYLCMKTSTHATDKMSTSPRSTAPPIEDIYGKKELDLEYWFSVPKEKYVISSTTMARPRYLFLIRATRRALA